MGVRWVSENVCFRQSVTALALRQMVCGNTTACSTPTGVAVIKMTAGDTSAGSTTITAVAEDKVAVAVAEVQAAGSLSRQACGQLVHIRLGRFWHDTQSGLYQPHLSYKTPEIGGKQQMMAYQQTLTKGLLPIEIIAGLRD